MRYLIGFQILPMLLWLAIAQAEDKITCTVTPSGGYSCSNGMVFLTEDESIVYNARMKYEKEKKSHFLPMREGKSGAPKMTEKQKFEMERMKSSVVRERDEEP